MERFERPAIGIFFFFPDRRAAILRVFRSMDRGLVSELP